MKKKMLAIVMTTVMAAALAGCGSTGSSSDTTTDASTSGTETSTSDASTIDIASIELGTDYTDVTADLKFLTHRTDLVDTDFQDYIAEFNKMYPNVTIEYEGITNYADDITTPPFHRRLGRYLHDPHLGVQEGSLLLLHGFWQRG